MAAYRELGDKLVSVGAYGESLVQGLEEAGAEGAGGVGEEVYAGWGQAQEGRTPTERWTPTPSRQGSEGLGRGVGPTGAEGGPRAVVGVPLEQDPWRDVPVVDPLPRYESGVAVAAEDAEALARVGNNGYAGYEEAEEGKGKGRAEVREV